MTQTESTSTLDLRSIVDLEAWQDPRFKAEVQANPKAAVAKLAAKYGFEVPSEIEFRTVSDADNVYHLVVSNNPAGVSPDDADSEIKGYIQSHMPTGQLASPTQPAAFISSTTCSIFCNPNICALGSMGPKCIRTS